MLAGSPLDLTIPKAKPPNTATTIISRQRLINETKLSTTPKPSSPKLCLSIPGNHRTTATPVKKPRQIAVITHETCVFSFK